ncbi:Ubiquitin domain-containing protein DSK2 [Spathaspora sp. JA1]|nr:Ubiquitin domain-containing protein DSK2 [Spathaspora sp. JA1]
MSDPITVTIKSSGDKKYEVTFDVTITVLELKELIAQQAEIPAESQRLIYSGKVLKDGETVSSYKVQNGHTIHLVKSISKSSGNASSSTTSNTTASTSTPQPQQQAVPSNIASGQGSFNPLADLTGARYAGYTQLPSASMFGPDGGMNANLPDPEQISQMMSNPLVQQQMNAMLSDPQMLDFMIQQNPQLRAMGPQVREMLQSPMFRQMFTNPEMMRMMMQMGGRGGAGPFGGADAATGGFPAPGANPNFDGPASGDASTGNTTDASAGTTPGTATGTGTAAGTGAGAAAANPFASLFPNGIPPIDPSALFGGAPPAAPVDNRPPEERYENQLRQLNDMGFFDFDRNVEALRRTGGSVQGAIEYLLGGN